MNFIFRFWYIPHINFVLFPLIWYEVLLWFSNDIGSSNIIVVLWVFFLAGGGEGGGYKWCILSISSLMANGSPVTSQVCDAPHACPSKPCKCWQINFRTSDREYYIFMFLLWIEEVDLYAQCYYAPNGSCYNQYT